MNQTLLFQKLCDRLSASWVCKSDFPYETPEATLKILWKAATGNVDVYNSNGNIKLPDVSKQQKKTLEELVEKRLRGIPLAYIIGYTPFMNLNFFCKSGVLIPRIETELLCKIIITILSDIHRTSKSILGIDIGCGCGNISCSIAKLNPNINLYAIDIADNCVDLTQKNVQHLNLTNQVTAYKGDMFSALDDLHLENSVDFIVSNPPYIPVSKLQSNLSHLTQHEPDEAFNGGVYGFAIHNRLIKESAKYLKPDGFLAFEFGIGQKKQVESLFKRAKGYNPKVEFFNDKNGEPRVMVVFRT